MLRSGGHEIKLKTCNNIVMRSCCSCCSRNVTLSSGTKTGFISIRAKFETPRNIISNTCLDVSIPCWELTNPTYGRGKSSNTAKLCLFQPPGQSQEQVSVRAGWSPSESRGCQGKMVKPPKKIAGIIIPFDWIWQVLSTVAVYIWFIVYNNH